MFAVDTIQASLPQMDTVAHVRPTALTADDVHGIVIAVQSVFHKLAKLQKALRPLYEQFGFRSPSAGVAARDLSERIEEAIVQHCDSFTKGAGHCDLARADEEWEVKICQHAGLTINQSKVVRGEHYITINYAAMSSRVRRIWVLWDAEDTDFSPRRANSNARHLSWTQALATGRAQLLFDAEAQR